MNAPGRREIGHGKLAWRAVRPMLPSKQDFPYTIRLVSEITESNGSSSMASVCGASLAMMDAGVPLKKPVSGIAMGLILEPDGYVVLSEITESNGSSSMASVCGASLAMMDAGVPLKKPVSGIAMGLILEKDGFAVLSDILGDEDHLGDMDFKVAGTADGITSLQMDIKIPGITEEIMQKALGQAQAGRIHILGEMAKAISGAREEIGEYAPKIETITIPTDKIRDVIGTGGKVIREIVATTGAKVDVSDDGTIKIAATDIDQAQQAIDWIRGIVAEPEIGIIYTGKVVKTADFGAFVNFLGSKDGLVHISELAQGRVNKTTDVVNNGDTVKVKVIGFDERGKVKLSMRVVDQATGADITEQVGARPPRGERPEREERSDRGRDRPRRDRDSAPAFESTEQPPIIGD